MRGILLSEIIQNAGSALQAGYHSFWQTVKDFQSIIGALIGAALSAAISTILALFISRKVAERGEVAFYLVGLTISARKKTKRPVTEGPFGGAVQVGTFYYEENAVGRLEDADYAKVTLRYEIYNGRNIPKTLRQFRWGIRVGRKVSLSPSLRASLFFEGGYKTMAILEPRSVKAISIIFTIDDEVYAGVKQHDHHLVLSFRDEEDKEKTVEIGGLRNNKKLDFENLPPERGPMQSA
jgi:hypothetical protein